MAPDDSGTLKCKVLECDKFDKRHTSKNLKDDFDRIKDEYDINIVHANVDNAKNVQGAVKELDGDSDGCAGHTFNLTAQDAKKASPEIKAVETKMNATIHFTRNSNEGKKYFQNCQKLAGFKSMNCFTI